MSASSPWPLLSSTHLPRWHPERGKTSSRFTSQIRAHLNVQLWSFFFLCVYRNPPVMAPAAPLSPKRACHKYIDQYELWKVCKLGSTETHRGGPAAESSLDPLTHVFHTRWEILVELTQRLDNLSARVTSIETNLWLLPQSTIPR